MHRCVLLLLLLVLASGCATGYGVLGPPEYEVRTLSDDFRGTVIHRLDGNKLPSPDQDFFDTTLPYYTELNVQSFTAEGLSEPIYSLIFFLRGGDWLFIRPGQSLSLLVDGEPVALTSESGSLEHRDVGDGGIVSERAWYTVTPGQLSWIARADSVRLRVDGQRLYVERRLSPENISNLRQFVLDHVEGTNF